MSNLLHIGLPPKGMILENGWVERTKAYCKLEIVPYRIENPDILDTAESFTQGLTPFTVDYGSFIARAALLGCKVPQNYEVGQIILYALQEGAVSETYTNSISASTLTGELAENFMNNSTVKFLTRASRELGINLGEQAAKLLNTMRGALGIEKDINVDEWKNNWTNAGTNNGKEWVRKELQQAFPDSPNLAKIGGILASNLVSMAKGLRPIYPQLWENSSSGTNYTFRVRLYNPNPANQDLHQTCIVNPLACLKALALPSSTVTTASSNGAKGGSTELSTQSNNCTYGPPLYVSVESKGLFNMPIGMIDNMSVVYGGDENSISFNGRPNYVDVSLSFKPLYQNKVIMVDSLQKFPANEFINMKTLIDDPDVGQTDENGKDNGIESGGEVSTSQIQGDSFAERGGTAEQKELNSKLMGEPKK